MSEDLPKSWERYEGETDLAFSFFISYLEMGGERSLSKVIQKHNKKKGYKTQLAKWSTKFDWVARTKDYDDYTSALKLEQSEHMLVHSRKYIASRMDHLVKNLFDIVDDEKELTHNRISAIKELMDRGGFVKLSDQQGTDALTDHQKEVKRIEEITSIEELKEAKSIG